MSEEYRILKSLWRIEETLLEIRDEVVEEEAEKIMKDSREKGMRSGKGNRLLLRRLRKFFGED